MENKSERIGELAKALARTQGMISGAVKGEVNPFFKSRYADLASVWEACRIPLSSNGLAIVQTVQDVNDKTCLVTTIMHESGEWMSSSLPMPLQKADPQTLGSAITYCRRYALQALVGICPVDDDAEKAMTSYREPKHEPRDIKPVTFKDVTKHLDEKELKAWIQEKVDKGGKRDDGSDKFPASYWQDGWMKQPDKAESAFFKWLELKNCGEVVNM